MYLLSVIKCLSKHPDHGANFLTLSSALVLAQSGMTDKEFTPNKNEKTRVAEYNGRNGEAGDEKRRSTVPREVSNAEEDVFAGLKIAAF